MSINVTIGELTLFVTNSLYTFEWRSFSKLCYSKRLKWNLNIRKKKTPFRDAAARTRLTKKVVFIPV